MNSDERHASKTPWNIAEVITEIQSVSEEEIQDFTNQIPEAEKDETPITLPDGTTAIAPEDTIRLLVLASRYALKAHEIKNTIISTIDALNEEINAFWSNVIDDFNGNIADKRKAIETLQQKKDALKELIGALHLEATECVSKGDALAEWAWIICRDNIGRSLKDENNNGIGIRKNSQLFTLKEPNNENPFEGASWIGLEIHRGSISDLADILKSEFSEFMENSKKIYIK